MSCTYWYVRFPFIWLSMCMHICMYVSMHACLSVCIYVCAYACMYVSIYLRMYLHMLVRLKGCIYVYMSLNTSAAIHTCIFVQQSMHSSMCITLNYSSLLIIACALVRSETSPSKTDKQKPAKILPKSKEYKPAPYDANLDTWTIATRLPPACACPKTVGRRCLPPWGAFN